MVICQLIVGFRERCYLRVSDLINLPIKLMRDNHVMFLSVSPRLPRDTVGSTSALVQMADCADRRACIEPDPDIFPSAKAVSALSGGFITEESCGR